MNRGSTRHCVRDMCSRPDTRGSKNPSNGWNTTAPIRCCRRPHLTKEAEGTDEQLIAHSLSGDERAWSELVERYARLVYSIPARHGMPTEDCDEIFQNVWTIAVSHLSSVRDHRSVPAWLITTTQRECWRYLRRQGREAHGAGIATGEDSSLGTLEELELLERRQELREAFAKLDAPCRDLLEAMFRPQGTPAYDELAERLSMPRGSIGPRRARCLEKLAALLGRAGAIG